MINLLIGLLQNINYTHIITTVLGCIIGLVIGGRFTAAEIMKIAGVVLPYMSEAEHTSLAPEAKKKLVMNHVKQGTTGIVKSFTNVVLGGLGNTVQSIFVNLGKGLLSGKIKIKI